MDNLWSDADAQAAIARYPDCDPDLALCVYTTRMLGGVRELVIHGGGNTSVKIRQRELTGDEVDVICVKGSGWNMDTIEPPGLPAVRLQPLQRLVELDALSDEDMVNVQRANLMDSTSPNPSVETLLHAFLPHRFINHTHTLAVLSLVNQPDGEALCRELYGDRMGYVPYIMPGFALSKKALEVWRENENVEGLVLLKHGLFTFGANAREAYDRHIEAVTMAEERIARAGRKTFASAVIPSAIAPVAEVAPILRGLTALDGADGEPKRWVLDFRTSDAILDFVNGEEVGRYSQQGTATPDYVIRTKATPLIVPAPEAGQLESFAAAAKAAVQAYADNYHAYFERNNARQATPKTELDRVPRVILVPGLGLFGLGASGKAARVAADLATCNAEVIANAESMSRYEVIPEADIFDMEYWSLEQAKLGKVKEAPLSRQIVAITGGGSGIGAACAAEFSALGAEVAVLDLDADRAQSVANAIGGVGIGCDVTRDDAVRAALDRVAATFGGVDIVVSNAGAAWQGRIGDVDETVLRESFDLNFWSHQRVAQAAVRIMRAQGTGGCLLFNASKQALNPGPDFGPYGLPKAALLALMKQYALDHGRDGIRSNAVNADRIRSGLLTDEMIADRAQARGLTEADYMGGNLLGQEVEAVDVARAFVHLALSRRTTGAVLTVDGGNIAASVR